MFSQRLHIAAFLACTVIRFFGVAPFKLDAHRLVFEYDPQSVKIMQRNYSLIVFWAISSFTLVIRYYKEGHVDRYNLTLAYWLIGILATALYSMLRWEHHDLAKALNGVTTFVQYVHRKFEET